MSKTKRYFESINFFTEDNDSQYQTQCDIDYDYFENHKIQQNEFNERNNGKYSESRTKNDTASERYTIQSNR